MNSTALFSNSQGYFVENSLISRYNKAMKILAIETSCDETAVAVVEMQNDKCRSQIDNGNYASCDLEILSNVVASQIDLHQKFGGVYPELASRAHTEKILAVINEAILNLKFKDQNAKLWKSGPQNLLEVWEEIDAIAVTKGPGLIGSLAVGVAAAKTLAFALKKPIIPINHWEGHLYSVWFEKPAPQFPALFLTVSGGHTNLILMKNHGEYEILGQTKDDAAGEAFDKVAKLLGFPYPGGPSISAEAEKFNNQRSKIKNVVDLSFPRPMVNEKGFDFSFSGLKTAVLYKSRQLGELNEELKAAIAYEFQEAVTDTLIIRAKQAAEQFKPKSICLTGGVSANKVLREKYQKMVKSLEWKPTLHIPPMFLTTDNAAMIGGAAIFHALSNRLEKWYDVNMEPNLLLK
jgi:N6-L-threonylcarbamoyladenine synthase